MKQSITLSIGLFTIASIYSMGNVTNKARSAHMHISTQASQLIQSDIDETTLGKWKKLFEDAQEFQKAHPQFPYLHLARRPGQGPDARSIINTAPIVINLLEHKCVEQEKLKKIVYNFGKQYMLKLATLPKH